MVARVHLGQGRGLRRGVALGVAVLLVVLFFSPGVGHAPTAQARAPSQTFHCGSFGENFTVPAGVTQLHVEAHGGQGQSRGGSLPGGFGGITIATIPVTPGQTLRIFAGCAGEHSSGAGWGFGGEKGIAHAADAEDGGFGGGGSAVIRFDLTELVAAAAVVARIRLAPFSDCSLDEQY